MRGSRPLPLTAPSLHTAPLRSPTLHERRRHDRGPPLAGSIALATLLGVIIPLGLKWRVIDPALAANIFVTGATDILSFVLFLGLAAIVIERIV